MKAYLTSIAVIALSISSATTFAASTSLYDNFEGENNNNNINVYPTDSHSIYNFNGFDNWDVKDGTVDLKAWDDAWISSCYNSNYCVDLDGTSTNAGLFETKQAFSAGNYKVSFALSGNQRKGTDSLTVMFGNKTLLDNTTFSYDTQWKLFSFDVSLEEAGTLSFSNFGGDNEGVLLDNVSVSSVPVPAAALLFAPALLGFIGLRRKAQRA